MELSGTRGEAAHRTDPTWRQLYRVGALMAALAVVAYVVALLLYAATTAPPEGDGAAMLEHVKDNRTAYIVKQLLWVMPNLPMMVVMLALAVAVVEVHRSFALIAGVIAVLAWAVGFAWPTTGEGSLAMVVLSDRYAAATTDAERATYIAGAELLIALNDLPAVVLGVLQTTGILLLALLMLRSRLPHGLAWLGVATGTIGIVAEALRPLLGWTYAGYGVLLFVWLIWVARGLWMLSETPEIETSASPALTARQCIDVANV